MCEGGGMANATVLERALPSQHRPSRDPVRPSYPHWGQPVWMTYSGVFPQVGGVRRYARRPCGSRAYFQRVDRHEADDDQTEADPHVPGPMLPIGYSVWVT